MMIFEKYTVHTWDDTGSNIDIDWPLVQKKLGVDCVKWVNMHSDCEFVIERQRRILKLVIDFYTQSSFLEFIIRKD